MQMNQDVIRHRVDGLRVAMQARQIDRDQAVRALAAEASRVEGECAARYPERHLGGALHMCPWHTCQGTRISPDASLT